MPSCRACGKPIVAVHAPNRGITLEQIWVHYSRRANRSHHAIPPRELDGGDA